MQLAKLSASFLGPGWRGKTIPEQVLSGKVFLPLPKLFCPVHFVFPVLLNMRVRLMTA
jgi:hypothetical protein